MRLSTTLERIINGEDGPIFVKPSFITAWRRFEHVCTLQGFDVNAFIEDLAEYKYFY